MGDETGHRLAFPQASDHSIELQAKLAELILGSDLDTGFKLLVCHGLGGLPEREQGCGELSGQEPVHPQGKQDGIDGDKGDDGVGERSRLLERIPADAADQRIGAPGKRMGSKKSALGPVEIIPDDGVSEVFRKREDLRFAGVEDIFSSRTAVFAALLSAVL